MKVDMFLFFCCCFSLSLKYKSIFFYPIFVLISNAVTQCYIAEPIRSSLLLLILYYHNFFLLLCIILGEYYVITGSRRNIECKRTTYQPYSLWSNESRSCAFEKSKCTQSGQVMYRIGSPIEDSQCRCDNTKQYAFVSTPENRCFCIPSKEDCSCFIKQCGFGYILNAGT